MQRGTDLEQHRSEAKKLSPQPYIELYEVRVNPSAVLRLTNHPNIDWNGFTWENWALELTGCSVKTTGEATRPQLRMANLNGAFSFAANSGWLYQGSVTRYRVLEQDLHNNQPSYLRNFWDIAKIASLNKDSILLELRAPMDRQDYKLPARQFFPPEFPYVTLR